MPPFHALVKQVVLLGQRLPSSAISPQAAPARLQALLEAIRPQHAAFNAEAIRFGDRYRSAFWAVYLLSPVAVLCAALPPALGWDVHLHSIAWIWSACELFVILCVAIIYWRGHQADWQQQWLAARTKAELAWYLPLLAPLLDFARGHDSANWYDRLFNPGEHLRHADDIDALCRQLEPLARAATDGAWDDAHFVQTYVAWALNIINGQRAYHRRVHASNHALAHRVHRITAALFALTALCAAMHLVLHSVWLSLASVFFPALGAALHGALAQSEAFRLEQNAARLGAAMEQSGADLRAGLAAYAEGEGHTDLSDAIEGALALILDEHQDWHRTVRPHHIPLG